MGGSFDRIGLGREPNTRAAGDPRCLPERWRAGRWRAARGAVRRTKIQAECGRPKWPSCVLCSTCGTLEMTRPLFLGRRRPPVRGSPNECTMNDGYGRNATVGRRQSTSRNVMHNMLTAVG